MDEEEDEAETGDEDAETQEGTDQRGEGCTTTVSPPCRYPICDASSATLYYTRR